MRTATEAVAAARATTRNRDDYCLFHVQSWLAAPWSGPYAEWAWGHWGGQHHGDRRPPPGVPVYWHSPRHKYGHIALSVGGGRIRSTDWPRDTYVGETSIDEMTRAWGIQYLGWSDRFSGGPIRGVGGAVPTRPAEPHAGSTQHPQRKAPTMLLTATARPWMILHADGNVTLVPGGVPSGQVTALFGPLHKVDPKLYDALKKTG